MKFGFARLDITPPFGAILTGYFVARVADDIIDPLQVYAVAFSDGERTAAAVSLDLIGICQPEMDIIRKRAAEKNGLDYEAVFAACTHTHTGPEVSAGRKFKFDPDYNEYLFNRISDAITLAIADMKEGHVEIARGEAKDIAFIRRFRMKDGSVRTNPGRLNPDVAGPIGTPDETVQLVKIVREDAADIAIVNFQVHPDTVGGTKICADYPGFVRRILEGALKDEKDGKGVHVIYFNGAQGDTNHVNVNVNLAKGIAHTEHMGRVIAGAVLSVYSYTEPVECDKVYYGQKSAVVPSNKGTDEEVAEAKAILKFHDEDLEGYKKAVAENKIKMPIGMANRLVKLENYGDMVELYLTCVGFGDVVFAGFPGEPFTDIGRGIKSGSPFKMTIPCCAANGYQGYFPMNDAFAEGGYEASSAMFKAGIAETLIETSVALTKEIKEK